MKIEKYICNSCGVLVKQSDYEVVIRRQKMCIECCGEVEMTEETLKRIELKNKPVLIIKAKNSKNNFNNLDWKTNNRSLRREPKPKKYKKVKSV